jgi:outer membrane protein OmpA-like peptidoglycan-associated protein
MFLGRGTAMKVYIDRERVASLPDVTGPGKPAEIQFTLGAPSKPMITNVRFAEGCRPAKDMLTEGKLVTYGIHFDTGSDIVLPDSAPILRQIAAYLESKPDVKLRITGHTDNVGKSPANLDLSKRRAASVANILATQFGITADRFQAEGKGDTVPLSTNVKPEGRAMNRRVEFSKIEG